MENNSRAVEVNFGRINEYIDTLFGDVVENKKVLEFKEELRTHMTERVSDMMAEGMPFEEAFSAAKEGLGDPNELLKGFTRKGIHFEDGNFNVNISFGQSLASRLIPLSPFIYVILGITQDMWQPDWWTWGWWAWGWMIIPVFAILFGGSGLLSKLVPLSPFAYVIVGIFVGGSWWAWGWMIVPISAILFSDHKKKKKKKKIKIIKNT